MNIPPVWKEIILRDLCESYKYGYTAKAQEKPVGPKFLRITDIVPDLIDWSSVPYCEIDSDQVEKYGLREGDIVIARTGATTGYAKRIRRNLDAIFASYLVRLRISDVHDNRYVGYVVESDIYKQFIRIHLGGAAQPNANAQVLTSFPMLLPPLSTQRKIAAILSAYDDLIENNTRRIAILEQMAQIVYREWFVHFRFPGHESARMVDSVLGPIPEGWQVGALSDLAVIKRDNVKPDESEDEIFEYYSFPAFDSNRMPAFERGAEIRSNKYLVHGGSVLLSKLNPHIPRVWLPFPDTEHRAVASTEFLILLPKEPFTCEYLFSLCNSQDFLQCFAGLATGTSTSHQRVKPGSLPNMRIPLPSRGLVREFGSLATPVFRAIHTLQSKNAVLSRTRDLLLPRLISGGVDVSRLDIDTKGVER